MEHLFWCHGVILFQHWKLFQSVKTMLILFYNQIITVAYANLQLQNYLPKCIHIQINVTNAGADPEF